MKTLFTLILAGYTAVLFGQAQVTELEYYIDSDPGVGNAQTVSITGGLDISETVSIDISGLEPGIHNLSVRAKDENDNWGMFTHQVFWVYEPTDQAITEYEYFMDGDPGVGNGTNVDVGDDLEIEDLAEVSIDGTEPIIHSINFRPKNAEGNWGMYTQQFFWTNNELDQTITELEYFVGPDPGVGNGTNIDVGDAMDITEIFDPTFDGLDPTHQMLKIRAKNGEGNWGIYSKELFVVNNLASPYEITAIEFFIDEDPGVGLGESLIFNPGMEVDEILEVPIGEEVSEGDHLLYIRVKHSGEAWSLYARDSITVDNTVGLLEERLQFSAYPNPVTDYLTISSTEQLTRVQVFDGHGKLVADENYPDRGIDCTSWANGEYIIRLTFGDQVLSKLISKIE